MAQNWWEQDEVVGGGTPAPAPSAPGVIYGRPKAPDPYKARDQELQEGAFGLSVQASRRAEEDQQMQRQRFGLDQQRLTADLEKNRNETAKIGTEQAKAGSFAMRAADALKAYEGAGLDPDSMIGQFANRNLPNVTAALSDDKRNAQRGVEREFIASVLRYDSGAAIPDSEFASAYQTYFPTPSAGPEEVASKKRARDTALRSLMLGAGPAAAQVAPSNQVLAPASAPEAPLQGFRLDPAQEGKLVAFAPQAQSPAEIIAFARGMGVEIPNEQAQQAFDYYRQGGKEAAQIDYTSADAKRRADLEAQLKARGQDDPSLNSAVQEIITRGASFGLTDEIAGIAGGLVTGNGYANERDLARLRQEKASVRLGGAALPLEFLGGLVGGGPGAGKAVMRTIREGAMDGGKTGAALGALGGFGYGEGEQSIPNALLGAGVGGIIGTAAGAGANALANRAASRAQPVSSVFGEAQDIAAAAQAEGIPISRPIVDPTKRNQMTYLETTSAGSAPVRQSLDETANAIEGKVSQIGGGAALDRFAAGETVQGAGRRFIESSGKQASAMYRRAEQLSGNAKIVPQQAMTEIDAQIADLSQTANTNAPLIKYLEEVKADLANGGGLSIQALRNMRTQIRGQISSRNLTLTDAERRMKTVLDAASADIAQGLPPNAQAAYTNADKAWRERITYINDVVKKFIGNRETPMSAEQAFAKLNSMAKGGDAKRLGEMMKSLQPDERADIASTFAEELGRSRNGDFSPALFVQHIEKLPARARLTLFGPDASRSLENLAKVSRAYRDTTANLNHSRTAVATNYKSWIGRASGLVGGVGGAASGGPATGAVGAYAASKVAGAAEGFFDARSARLLMNEDVTRWLASAPATRDPAAISAHFKRLEVIANRNPAIAGEISGLQQRIAEAARGALSGPSAANDISDTGERPPQKQRQ